MRASTIPQLALAVIVTLLFSACGGYPDHLKAIPANSTVVVSIDLESLAKKGDLTNLDDTHFFQKMKKGDEEKKRSLTESFNEVMNNPVLWGFDFTENVFAFYESRGGSRNYAGFTAGVRNPDKFQEIVENIYKESATKPAIEKRNGYRRVALKDKEVWLGWDDDKAIVLMGTDLTDSLEYELDLLMQPKPVTSITDNKDFKGFFKDIKDIDLWVSTNLFADIAAREGLAELSAEYLGQMEKIKNNSFEMHTSFEEDAIVTKGRFNMNEELKKQYGEEDLLKKKSDPKMLAYVNDKDLVSMGYSLNTGAYYTMIANQYKKEMAMAEMAALGYLGTDIKKFMTDVIGGDMLISFTGVRIDSSAILHPKELSEDEKYYQKEFGIEPVEPKATTLPLASFIATVKDEAVVNNLIKKMVSGTKEKDGYYTIELAEMSIMTGVKNGIFFLTTDKAVADGTAKDLYKTAKLSPLADEFESHAAFGYFNLKYDTYPADVRNLLEANTTDTNKVATFKSFVSLFENVKFVSTGQMSGESTLNLKKTGKNSLSAIIRHIDQVVYEAQQKGLLPEDLSADNLKKQMDGIQDTTGTVVTVDSTAVTEEAL